MTIQPLTWMLMLFFVVGITGAMRNLSVSEISVATHLTYSQTSWLSAVHFSVYLLASPLAGYVLRSGGILKGFTVGLCFMMMSCFVLHFALEAASYWALVVSTVLVAGSFAILGVCMNPYTLACGTADTSTRRLAAAQATSGFGMVSVALFGSLIHTGSQVYLAGLCVGVIALCAVLLGAILSGKLPPREVATHEPNAKDPAFRDDPALWQGVLCMGAVMGAEISLSAFLLLYAAQALNYPVEECHYLIGIYWSLFVVGRLSLTFILKRFSESLVLLVWGLAGLVSGLLVVLTSGFLSVGILVSMGYWISGIGPIIYSLTMRFTRTSRPRAAGYLGMANIGGAIFPVIEGQLALHLGLHNALGMISFCFLGILGLSVLINRQRRLSPD